MSATEGYRAAMALTGARLRGDEEGEQVIAGECCASCRPLLDGILRVAEVAIKAIAASAKMSPSEGRGDARLPTVAGVPGHPVNGFRREITRPGGRCRAGDRGVLPSGLAAESFAQVL